MRPRLVLRSSASFCTGSLISDQWCHYSAFDFGSTWMLCLVVCNVNGGYNVNPRPFVEGGGVASLYSVVVVAVVVALGVSVVAVLEVVSMCLDTS